MNDHHDRRPALLPVEELKAEAARVAKELDAARAGGQPAAAAGSGGGSRHRGLPEELRTRFIDVRAALIQRGVFDPVLVRFDTATVTQATTAEVADQLAAIAQNL